MDFKLTSEQEMIRDMVRDFTEKNIKPVAPLYDEEKQFPFQNLKRMAGLGLMGMNIPAAYGGAEVGVVAYSLAITEIAKGCASHAVTTSVTNMVAEVICEFAQEEIKRKYIPKLCNGQYPAGSFAITEPHTGSDAANIRATANRQKDTYALNGRRPDHQRRCLWGDRHLGGDRSKPRRKGISAFVVEKETPGFQGKAEEDGPPRFLDQ
jgi:butyryl-CoA dehydrogenase